MSAKFIPQLKAILAKDDKRSAAYIERGDDYYERANWQQAVNYYENAREISDLQKIDKTYFTLAWAYSKLKDYVSEEAAKTVIYRLHNKVFRRIYNVGKFYALQNSERIA